MNGLNGQYLQATSLLNGSFFEQAILFISEHNENGATGFVINKPFARKLNELMEFSSSQPFTLYDGGPVEREGLFFIHKRPDLIEDGKPVGNAMYVGGNFNQAVEAINTGTINTNHIRIFIGYCGWDAGELEAEMEEGSWTLMRDSSTIVFQ